MLKTFLRFLSESRNIGNKWYLMVPKELSELNFNLLPAVGSAWNDDDPTTHYIEVNSQVFKRYKRGISGWSSADGRAKYIYQITKPLRAWIPDRYNMEFMVDKGVVTLEDLAKNWGIQETDRDTIIDKNLEKIKGKRISEVMGIVNVAAWNKGKNWPKFRQHYDAVSTDGGDVVVFWDIVQNYAKLVDGNVKRFSQEYEGDFPIAPEDMYYWTNIVLRELKRYTDDAGKRFNSKDKQWLLQHFHKPYESITLWRGFSIQFDDFGGFNGSPIEYLKKLKKFTGLSHWEDCHVGGQMTVKRGKESSWSTHPVIANNFTSGLAGRSINFSVTLQSYASMSANLEGLHLNSQGHTIPHHRLFPPLK